MKFGIKRLMMILLLFVVTITFCACAEVRMMTIDNSDGTIDEIVTITLNDEEISQAGVDKNELTDNIEDMARKTSVQLNDILNAKIEKELVDRGLVYDSKLNSYLNGISALEGVWEESTFTCGIRFKNYNVYKFFYGIDDSVKSEPIKEEHFFYTKIIYKSITKYAVYGEFYKDISTEFKNKYPELKDSLNKKLFYTYRTELRREHSNADEVVKQGDYYFHTWKVDDNNLNEKIERYYLVAEPGNCLLAIIGVSLTVSVVVLVINLIKKTNKKSRN